MIKRGLLLIFLGIFFLIANPVFAQISDTDAQKLFSVGRSLGSAYYHLIDLNNKSRTMPYADIRTEYQDAFQSLNITDLIVEDLNINSESKHLLNEVRLNLYNALNKQDLSETKLTETLNSFNTYYQNLIQYIGTKYEVQGRWLTETGFYSSFQLASINSDSKAKLLLSGFTRLSESVPLTVPENISTAIKNIQQLDKPELTVNEIESLKTNLVELTEYFSNYPEVKSLNSELQQLTGTWQGILINPDCKKFDIKLRVNNDLTAVMDINNIAQNIPISDVKLVNNYFTFLFKPLETEKLYIKFNAKLSDDMFTGEIEDVLGEKGHWILARADNNGVVNENNLSTMFSYVKKMEENLGLREKKNITQSETAQEPTTTQPAEQTQNTVRNTLPVPPSIQGRWGSTIMLINSKRIVNYDLILDPDKNSLMNLRIGKNLENYSVKNIKMSGNNVQIDLVNTSTPKKVVRINGTLTGKNRINSIVTMNNRKYKAIFFRK